MDELELKPCKCGGKGIEYIGDGDWLILVGVPIGKLTTGHKIRCDKCGQDIGPYTEPWMAVNVWNEINTNNSGTEEG